MTNSGPSPQFSHENPRTYAHWRDWRLDQAPLVQPASVRATSSQIDLSTILENCSTQGFSVFKLEQTPDEIEPTLQQLALGLGLNTLDENLCAEDSGLTEIRVKRTPTDNNYIPYTNKPLGWHTDGYYNMADQQIHAWLLYCAQPAQSGGSNGLLDHQIAYIRLRDENPEWIRALSEPTAFTIPPNFEGGRQIRPASVGPVFSTNPDGTLHMRYSARQRNVIWANDSATQEAAQFLLQLLESNDPHIVHLQLQQGHGVISNNVLHNRTGFSDSPERELQRRIYRARFYDRITSRA